MEGFAFELTQAFYFCDRVGALEPWVQQPDFGDSFVKVTIAAFTNLRETVSIDDRDTQERDARRWLFQVGSSEEIVGGFRLGQLAK